MICASALCLAEHSQRWSRHIYDGECELMLKSNQLGMAPGMGLKESCILMMRQAVLCYGLHRAHKVLTWRERVVAYHGGYLYVLILTGARKNGVIERHSDNPYKDLLQGTGEGWCKFCANC